MMPPSPTAHASDGEAAHTAYSVLPVGEGVAASERAGSPTRMVPFFPTAMKREASSGDTPRRSSWVSVGTLLQVAPLQRTAAPLAPTATTFSGEVPATALRSAR